MSDPVNPASPAIPATVFVETYGCAFNQSDGEVMSALMERAGYRVVDSPDLADVVVVNSCTVKDRTVLDFRKRLSGLAEPQPAAPAIVLAGCVPRVAGQSREFHHFSQIGPDTLTELPDVVRRTLNGEVVHCLVRAPDPDRLAHPVRRRNPAVEIIPISKGCLGSCTFCQTVLARGRLYSYPEAEILERIRRASEEGVRQVWLTSQDCAAYGFDRGSNLARLLRKIAALPGDFQVRIGMANPDLIKLFLPELCEVLPHPRFFRFLHVPVQSGSDRVLAAMKRLYAADDFRRIVSQVREVVPDITVATDVIAGFPEEDDHDFESTVQLLEECAVPVVNRSRFSPRPGTAAARLTPVASEVVSRRSARLYEVCRAISQRNLQPHVGKRTEVLVEHCPKPGAALARTTSYKPVVVTGESQPGDRLTVRLVRVEGFHLHGVVVA